MGSLNIVLYEPGIPQNTGNIMRTCVATGSVLHLIEPLGFRLDQRNVKRSGVNYMSRLRYFRYRDWNDFVSRNHGEMYFLTRYGIRNTGELNTEDKEKDYYFILGNESTGIPTELLREHLDRCFRIPMTADVRALNVSNCVAVILYEALRQQGFPGLEIYEPDCNPEDNNRFKGKNFLRNNG